MSDGLSNPPKPLSQQFDLAKNSIDRIEKPVHREPRPGVSGHFDKAATTSLPEERTKPDPIKTTMKTPLSFPSPGMRHNMKTPLGQEVTRAHTGEAISKERATQIKALNAAVNKSRSNFDKTLELMNENKHRDDRSK